MNLAPAQHRAYTYKVTTPPAVDLGSALLDTFKCHVKVDGIFEDDLLLLYLQSAVEYAENFTRRDLINRTYETKRDFFPNAAQNEGYYPFGIIPTRGSNISFADSNVGFELRKSALQSVTEISYVQASDSVLTVLSDTEYYNSTETDYSEVLAINDWPTDVLKRLQTVTLTFVSGFGAAQSDIPKGYILAILNHAASLYANRGDCSDCAVGGSSTNKASMVPAASRMFYLQNRIENL